MRVVGLNSYCAQQISINNEQALFCEGFLCSSSVVPAFEFILIFRTVLPSVSECNPVLLKRPPFH